MAHAGAARPPPSELAFEARWSHYAPMFELLLLALLGPLLVAGLSYGLLWYDTAPTEHRAVLEHHARGRLGLLFARLILKSWRAQMLALGSLPLAVLPSMRRPVRAPVTDSANTPVVVLVHGLYHSAGGWALFRRWLKAEGFETLYALNYNSFLTDVPRAAERLARLVEEVRRAHPHAPLHLIGHSMGGLIIRMLLGKGLAKGVEITSVVYIGTPHRGSKLAAFGLGSTARSLLIGSPLLTELERCCVPDTPTLSLYTDFDNMVTPPLATRMPEKAPWREEDVGLVTHVGMIYNARVARRVAEYLRATADSHALEACCPTRVRCRRQGGGSRAPADG